MHTPRPSIAGLVTLGIVAATTVVLGALGFVGYRVFCLRQQADFTARQALLADQLAASVALPLSNLDQPQLEKILDSAAPVADVYAVAVRASDRSGRLYARVRDAAWHMQSATALPRTDGLVVETRAIAVNGSSIGTLQVCATPRTLAARLQRTKWAIVATIAGIDLLLVAGLYLLLWWAVLKPLRAIERYAVAIADGRATAQDLAGKRYWGELETLRCAVERTVAMLETRYAELRKSEARYRLLAENVGDVIWTRDLTGRLTYMSPSVERMLGYPPDQVLHAPVEKFFTATSARQYATLIEEIVAAIAHGQTVLPGRIELEGIHRDGTRKWIEIAYEILPGPDGRPTAIMGVSRDTTERRAALAVRERALLREQEARREFTQKLITSQEEERRRIAAELHDSLGQELLLIKNRAVMARRQCPDDCADLVEQLDGISELATHAIAEVRQISHDLRPFQLDQLGLTRALRAMAEKTSEASPIEFKYRFEDVDDLFVGDRATELYRIAQEALNNVLKHSEAKHARIELERDLHEVTLLVEDDGQGFAEPAPSDRNSPGGFGMLNISERVGILGGVLNLTAAPGAGTRLAVTIPISDEPGEAA